MPGVHVVPDHAGGRRAGRRCSWTAAIQVRAEDGLRIRVCAVHARVAAGRYGVMRHVEAGPPEVESGISPVGTGCLVRLATSPS